MVAKESLCELASCPHSKNTSTENQHFNSTISAREMTALASAKFNAALSESCFSSTCFSTYRSQIHEFQHLGAPCFQIAGAFIQEQAGCGQVSLRATYMQRRARDCCGVIRAASLRRRGKKWTLDRLN
jgi:hypothetical protein